MFVTTAVQFGPTKPDRERFIHPLDHTGLIRYFEQLRLVHGSVKLLGLPDVDERNDDLPLRSLFVEPRVGPEQLGTREFNEATALKATQPLLEALVEHQRLVLLGDPGTGKTTVTNWLCTALAQPLENEVSGTLGRLVPLPFILRDLPLGVSLSWDVLLEQFLSRPFAAPLAKDRDLLEKLLDSGQAVILLDGIDEVGGIARRKVLRDAVWEGWHKWSRCRWVLTSRVVGYSEMDFSQECLPMAGFRLFLDADPSGSRNLLPSEAEDDEGVLAAAQDRRASIEFAEILHLSPFTDRQVRQFIENWFRLREPDPALAQETTKNLIEALNADAGTKELARIPNLLTLIALIYRVRAKLPDGRAELYLQISQAYLKTIDEFRKLKDLPPYTFEEKMSWLARVGWEMQLARTAGGQIEREDAPEGEPREYLATEAEVRGWLEKAMETRFGSEAGVEAERFLDYVQRRTGLLLARGEKRFGFLHLSFQEFFAARYLAAQIVKPVWAKGNLFPNLGGEDISPTSITALRGYCGTTLWQEALVFLFETLAIDWCEPILERLYLEASTLPSDTEKQNIQPEDRARWLLAARIAGDPHVALSQDLRQRLMEACWRWELNRCSNEGEGEWWSARNGVSQQLFARRDMLQSAWNSLKEAFRERSSQSWLDLSGCVSLVDLSPLRDLAGLQRLSLDACASLADVRPLKKQEELHTLCLSGCASLVDVEPLKDLKRLDFLDLSGCTSLVDLEPLKDLQGLQGLNLSGCASLTDFEPLKNLKGLKWLNLSSCASLVDLEALRGLEGLEGLDLSCCTSLVDLEPLKELTALEELDLSGCRATSNVWALKNLKNLNGLNLGGWESLVDIEPLRELKSLEGLDLSGCRSLVDVGPLEDLTSLKWLDLSGCSSLESVGALKDLRSLVELNLNGCRSLADVGSLKDLEALKSLSLLNCTSLVEMRPLEDLEALRFLILEELGNQFPETVTRLRKRGVGVY
ncbi:NACHT domain-containing protein [Haloferula sargassicola]|uniref:NACHT domain-containing protein n=1 Tax=Haloferula sargassicola TaxID=490096 RepID=A0ABP9UPA9_9BACT